MYLKVFCFGVLCFCFARTQVAHAQRVQPVVAYDFDGVDQFVDRDLRLVESFDGRGLRLGERGNEQVLGVGDLRFSPDQDFSLLFWVRSNLRQGEASVILSNKDFQSKSLKNQKKNGWAFYLSNDTWAWNLGNGERRLTHEHEVNFRKNRQLSDGEWHQLGMTYDSQKGEVRLFFDGVAKAFYNVRDSIGFDFEGANVLRLGTRGSDTIAVAEVEAEVRRGATLLQELVDEFRKLNIGTLDTEKLQLLITEPKDLVDSLSGGDRSISLKNILAIRSRMMSNPYTIHQVMDFMKVAPLHKIYYLEDHKIYVKADAMRSFVDKTKFVAALFDVDNLSLFDRAVSTEEVFDSYAKHFAITADSFSPKVNKLVVGNWNIHHGGKHNTIEKDGWDSRQRIVEMLNSEQVDVVMLQETYSSGALLAEQMGFYYASTIDRDYLNQGSNISVLSRYPIKEIYVPGDATFMNVAVKVQLSETQEVYVMSNWYGMNIFESVFNFHKDRFSASDSIPVLFSGDFNAVPASDGGTNLGADKLIEDGFIDAYRELYPDVARYPGYTFESGVRIDQLFYKGQHLKNSFMKVIDKWETGFPSDHHLMITGFELK